MTSLSLKGPGAAQTYDGNNLFQDDRMINDPSAK